MAIACLENTNSLLTGQELLPINTIYMYPKLLDYRIIWKNNCSSFMNPRRSQNKPFKKGTSPSSTTGKPANIHILVHLHVKACSQRLHCIS